jgi:hypothetical protein
MVVNVRMAKEMCGFGTNLEWRVFMVRMRTIIMYRGVFHDSGE